MVTVNHTRVSRSASHEEAVPPVLVRNIESILTVEIMVDVD